MDKTTKILTDIAIQAGEKIMDIYDTPFQINIKKDSSPLTEADLVSNKTICNKLRKYFPDIPIISEESTAISWNERKNFNKYWLVDPLDGTKEFVKRNGEFTVNIALMESNLPVFSVVYVPVSGYLYFASKNSGAYKYRSTEGIKTAELIKVKQHAPETPWKIVASRSHKYQELENFLSGFDNYELIEMGSSMKFCLVAEGKADIYPRFGPTSEWDTAAAQLIVSESGGCVLEAQTGKTLMYNVREKMRNPNFYVLSQKSYYYLFEN